MLTNFVLISYAKSEKGTIIPTYICDVYVVKILVACAQNTTTKKNCSADSFNIPNLEEYNFTTTATAPNAIRTGSEADGPRIFGSTASL